MLVTFSTYVSDRAFFFDLTYLFKKTLVFKHELTGNLYNQCI